MIDARTGLVIWALEAVSLSAVLIALWFGMRRSQTILYWSMGFALHGIGVGTVAMRGFVPDFLSIQIANTAALLGIGFLLAGARALDNRPISFTIFIPSLIWASGMLVPSIAGEMWARIALYQTAASTGHLMIGLALASGRKPELDTRNALAALQFVQCLQGIAVIMLVIRYKPSAFNDVPHALAIAMIGALIIVGSLILGTRLMMLENENKLKRLAETDPLTNTLNRRGFERAFELITSAFLPDRPMIALVHFDLDHFKRINDIHGHQAGDAVLVTFARTVNAVTRHNGTVARLGGEEFAYLLRVSSAVEAVEAAGQIRHALKRTPVTFAGKDISATVSAGISLAPHTHSSLVSLLSSSDRALYAAKNAGRDRIGLDCEDSIHIISADDEACLCNVTDLQVAELQHMGLIGRS